jgi:phage terminase large subunit-like protein
MPEIEVDGRKYPDFPGMARVYAQKVADGELLVCRWVRLACERYLRMLKDAQGGRALFYFSIEDVVDVCDFIEKLPRSKGGRPGELLVLQPWQCWALASIFGFRRADPEFPATWGERLVRDVYLEIPRGSGKSEILAAIALYCFLCEGEEGSQVYIGAPKDDQADKVYIPIKTIVEKTPELAQNFGLRKPTLNEIKKFGDSSAFITKVSHIAEREDGHDPHVVIMEELHAQDEGLYSVMQSSQGKRTNNLFISITTAGRRATGICWNVRKRLQNILQRIVQDDSFFGVIYGVDQEDEDDPKRLHRRETIMKANPMWGISLDPSMLLEQLAKAKTQNEAAVLEFDRTRLNLWRNVDGGLILPENWKSCLNPKLRLEDFKGCPCWIGADLGSKNDMTALVALFQENGRVQAFAWYWVPEKSPTFRKDMAATYEGWIKAGKLVATPGGVTNYRFIEKQIRELCVLADVKAIVFDSYQSNDILSRLFEDNLPAMEMHPGTKHISDPTKDIQALVECGQFEHDGHPVLEWNAMNVVGHTDKRENILPQKDDPNSPNKIDGFSALVMANAVRLDAALEVPTKRRPSSYTARGGELFQIVDVADEREDA